MLNISESLENLIQEFSKLPSIGRKTALRISMYLLKQPREEVEKFSASLIEAKDRIKFCSVCCNITEDEVCRICSSSKRARNIICVVEEPQDVIAIEKTNEYRGLYHVLHGRISPLDGIGPNDIKIKELLQRLGEIEIPVDEIILALNPDVEGETTILYLNKIIRPLDIKTTRIARGIPIGSELEFADEVTLAKALEGRVVV
ncbi:MAG TPA: recombination mediator RecR [Ignavibacteria bacterium]|nr:recombination mediator RecR [Ignavibacteria bacterium]